MGFGKRGEDGWMMMAGDGGFSGDDDNDDIGRNGRLQVEDMEVFGESLEG